ncbi:MAG: Na/Pi cotransporter family protein, partial [Clostridia bacterium]|nr:Na/Pi cotransporter family protein [Clostridia bacterium]
MDFFSILTLIGGLALFLYGMDVMGDGLKKLSGSKLEYFLGQLTSNKFKGFLLGFIVTAIIQSSSATTVMLVGFVNSGIMRLSQTISTIMGANVGTTVTAWLLSTSGINGDSFFLKILKPDAWTPILAAIGVGILMFSKSDRKKNVALILLGFAVLMFGMDTMSAAVSGLKDNENFTKILIMFENPIMGILAGLILTAIIQSSSASVGILQALSATGTISYAVAIPIILGQNIGTTITPILSAINGNKEAKQVAATCLYIKIIGVIAVCLVFYILNSVIVFPFMQEGNYVNAFNIAVIHTLFNIISTIILVPFSKQIEKLALMTFKDNEEHEKDPFATLDDRFLRVPSFAVEKCRELAYEMAQMAKESVIESTNLMEKYDRDIVEDIVKQEKKVDKYE